MAFVVVMMVTVVMRMVVMLVVVTMMLMLVMIPRLCSHPHAHSLVHRHPARGGAHVRDAAAHHLDVGDAGSQLRSTAASDCRRFAAERRMASNRRRR